jgi:hypothetical protein
MTLQRNGYALNLCKEIREIAYLWTTSSKKHSWHQRDISNKAIRDARRHKLGLKLIMEMFL